jgi:hypothetical protein
VKGFTGLKTEALIARVNRKIMERRVAMLFLGTLAVAQTASEWKDVGRGTGYAQYR